MTIRLICIDADDTLWHNEPYFRSAAEQVTKLLAQLLGPSRAGGDARSGRAPQPRDLRVRREGLRAVGHGDRGRGGGRRADARHRRGDPRHGPSDDAASRRPARRRGGRPLGPPAARPARPGHEGRPLPPGGEARRIGARAALLRRGGRQQQDLGRLPAYLRAARRAGGRGGHGGQLDAVGRPPGPRGRRIRRACSLPPAVGARGRRSPAGPQPLPVPRLLGRAGRLDRPRRGRPAVPMST